MRTMRMHGVILGLLLTAPMAMGGVLPMPELSAEDSLGSLLGHESTDLHADRIGSGYPLLSGKGWSIGPVLQSRFEGNRSADKSVLDSMEDRRLTADAGIRFSWETGVGFFSASWLTGVLGGHKGFETEFAYALWFPWRGFDVIPSAGVRCKSSDLTSYYYGTDGAADLPGRPGYKAGSAIDPFVRIAMKKRLAGRLSMLGAVQCEWFDSEIRNSPVVDHTYSTSLLFGLLYAF